MAIKIYEQFAPFANPADGDYPYGSIKNDSIPGAEDGTPLDAVWGNDMVGFTDALLAETGITPSGNPDKLGASQRVEAIKLLPKPATKVFNEVISGISRDTQSRSLDTLNILDFGGLDDDDGSLTTTNSKNAFAAYFAYLNSVGGGKMYLPKTITGGYFINGDDATPVTSPIEIVADEGVYIRLIYSGGSNDSPLANNNLKYSRELLKIQQNFGFNVYGNQHAGQEPSKNLQNITQTQGIYSEPRKLSGLNFTVVDLDDPDNVVPPISAGSDAITFDGTGKIIAAVKASKIGEEVLSLLSSPTGGAFFSGVSTVNGYAYFSQNSGTLSVELKEVTTGLSDVVLGVTYTLMDQQRDLFNNSLLSVRVISVRKFSVLCNGLVIGTYNTRSNITGVMFGADNIPDTIAVSQSSAIKTNSTGGSKPLRIACIGDSISDNNVQYSPFRIMAQVLQSQGIQLAELNNLSVAGENAAQQYARLTDPLNGIGVGYDFILDQTGVNDIQGLTPLASFSSTKTDICNYAKTIGAVPIVGIQTQFYSLAEAMAHGQSGGQNTSNNQLGYSYRAATIRAVAEAGGIVNLQSLKNSGAITASWLDADVTGVQIDPVVTDNIHPTPYGVNLEGLGYAESVVGSLHRINDSDHQPFESVPASWMRNGFGSVSRPTMKGYVLSGVVDLTGGVPPEGTPFMKLPRILWPVTTKLSTCTALLASGLPAGVANIYIGADGNCYGFNLPALTDSISLGSIDLSDVAFV